MRKSVLFVLLLASSGCGKLPPFPAVWQCAHVGNPARFHCVNTETDEVKVLSDSSEQMQAAQCLSLDDYRSVVAWVNSIKSIAEKRCK